MDSVRYELRSRTRDILGYVRMIRHIDRCGGLAIIQGQAGQTPLKLPQATVHVLKAGVFLHLYNLVESTISAALRSLTEEIRIQRVEFRDLSDPWRRAWAQSFQRDENLTADNRLLAALRLCQAIVDQVEIQIEPRLSGGNLDDRRIEALAERFGIELNISKRTTTLIKKEVFDKLGFLGLIRHHRNSLAHGGASFADVGREYSASDLCHWTWQTYQYLREATNSFDVHLKTQRYRRSAGGDGS